MNKFYSIGNRNEGIDDMLKSDISIDCLFLSMFSFLQYILLGIGLVSVIATVGAVASRKFGFKYAYLTTLSFAVYIFMSLYLLKRYSLVDALVINSIVGLYDGTISLWLCIRFKANINPEVEEGILEMSFLTAIFSILASILFTFIGYGLSFM